MTKHFVLLMLVLGAALTACKKTSMDCRETAWEYIGAEQQATVTGDWKQAPVFHVTYSGKKACKIRFNTTDDALIGPIVVYVDEADGTVLGQDLRM